MSYTCVICNLLLKRQTKGWKFRTPCQTCLSAPFLKGKNSPCFPWWGKELVGNFHNYIVLLKSCANLLSFSLWINTTQCFMENWDSLTLTLFGGKKKWFGLESFTLHSIILLFATQKLCLSSPLCLSLFEISKMFLDVEINTIIV